MKDITVAFKKEDLELVGVLNEKFGDDLCIYESKGFDGLEFVFVALIPIISVTIDVIDFFLNHFAKEKNTGRVIFKEDQGIEVVGDSAVEVKELLEILMDEDKDD